VIQSGVDTEFFIPATTAEDRIVSVGRQSREKAFEDFEWIARNLHQEFPSISFQVAGGQAKEDEDVKYVGYIDDIRTFLAKAIIFVTTSLTEGMANVVLEAQAMGIPVVARSLGSITEVVKDGITGMLGKNREELLSACRILLRNSEMRKEMGKKARENIEANFSIAMKMKSLEAIYSELL